VLVRVAVVAAIVSAILGNESEVCRRVRAGVRGAEWDEWDEWDKWITATRKRMMGTFLQQDDLKNIFWFDLARFATI
jgi:hypothetical protein